MFRGNKGNLISKAKKGDGKAFTELIEENIKGVYRVAKGTVKSRLSRAKDKLSKIINGKEIM
ncbi:hypothetical protein [Clostridium sp.]|uniref:hypothetical protein n=1 Tax=Clostridium sp. TaxID=1506 RepID=UPI00290888BE|nr:hypothetical protein [Clostridium sp.]MDU5105430.1 hypothetical protein [Clostridium sp.]